MQGIVPISRRPLHEEAVSRLRELIEQGRLAPGARLNERVLCEQLGISRTPLREAIKLLATEGLVELLPNRGAVVTALDAQRLGETLQVMGALEAVAGELACRNASVERIQEIRRLHLEMIDSHAKGDLDAYFHFNQAIHARIVEASGNAVLATTYRQLNANVRRARYMANLSKERWDKAVREHEEILDALAERNVTKLKKLLREHLEQKLSAVVGAVGKAA
jgi:DNA-binding GntR family transcriptional regulator